MREDNRFGFVGPLGAGFVALLLIFAVVVPASNLMLPPGSALHVSTASMGLAGKYLSYALLAVGLDLVWGYCGILSLGHGAFFALGGYAMGMYLMRQIGSRGVYGNPLLPDFMVFLNWTKLPWYWSGFDQFPFAATMVVLVPGILAFVFGWFAFRSRVTGVYLSIITQAMTYALQLAFFRNDMGFGGNNGMTDFKDILGFPVQADGTRAALFSITCLALACGYLICRAITSSKLGKVLIAVRDAEGRVRFLGYRVENYKLFVFTVSACLAGIAGALYVPQIGIINPSEFAPGEFDRDGHLGRGRRAWNPYRRGARRHSRQLGEDRFHERPARGILALRARRPVRAGDALSAEGCVSARSSLSCGRARPPLQSKPGLPRAVADGGGNLHSVEVSDGAAHTKPSLSRRRDGLIRWLQGLARAFPHHRIR